MQGNKIHREEFSGSACHTNGLAPCHGGPVFGLLLQPPVSKLPTAITNRSGDCCLASFASPASLLTWGAPSTPSSAFYHPTEEAGMKIVSKASPRDNACNVTNTPNVLFWL